MLNKEVTVGQLISSILVILAAVLSFWINTNVRLSALEIYKGNQEASYHETKEMLKTIGDKIDNLNTGQNDIKISLERKVDRKK